MCGIAGIYDPCAPPTEAEVRPMVDRIRHRGPDGDGFLFDGPIGMGMRRLAIIDLSTGDQPLFSEDGTIAVVFNGEIFNYRELRAELVGRGHTLRTSGDTETLVHLYEDFGTQMLTRLNGMFAFALWDRRRGRLLLARDRMGIKPLYLARVGQRLLFGSELKALLTRPELSRTLDRQSLGDYLTLGYIPGEHTPFAAVRRLLPGHYLLADRDGVTTQRWWDLAALPTDTDEHTETALPELFDDAVRMRMIADVPVAAFLSGGLDSSLVVATAAPRSPHALQTYHVRFAHTMLDESPYARAVAARSGTDFHEVVAEPTMLTGMLDRIAWHMDEPIADTAVLSSFLVSRLAAQTVKVCLSGLGGDELFGGYARYLAGDPGRIRTIFAGAPRLAGALAAPMRSLRHGWGDELLLAAGQHHAWRSYMHHLRILPDDRVADLGLRSERAETLIADLWRRYPGHDPVGRRQFIDQQSYLPDQILALTDKLSMAHSLEARVPFLDYRLVALAARLPAERKQTSERYKIALVDGLGDRLPQEVLRRPKWGFDAPFKHWGGEAAIEPRLRRLPDALRDIVDRRAVRRLLDEAATGKGYGRSIFALLMLESWLRVHDSATPPVYDEEVINA